MGGYSSLLEPPTRPHSRLPCFIDEDSLPEDTGSLYEDVYYNRYVKEILSVNFSISVRDQKRKKNNCCQCTFFFKPFTSIFIFGNGKNEKK